MVARHIQVTISGAWVGAATALSDEIWQFGWKTLHNVSEGTPQEIADASSAGVSTAFGASPMTAQVIPQSIKIAFIGTDGQYEEAPGIDALTTVSGATAPSNWVPQGTSVITTVASSVFRGKGRYGRFYVPWYTTTQGVMTTATQDALGTWARNLMLAVVHQDDGVPLLPAHFPSSLETSYQIDQLRVGRVVDTQRRRRNKIDEAYRSRDFPGS